MNKYKKKYFSSEVKGRLNRKNYKEVKMNADI